MTGQERNPVDYIDEARRSFRGYKRLAEGTIAQLGEADFFYAPDPESNSIAVIVKHIAGNLRSRWMDFLTTDGEKPNRNRDQEFVLEADNTRTQLMNAWEESFKVVFDSLAGLKPDDIGRTVTIRGEPHTVLQALSRSIAHTAYHVGQITYLGKHICKADWKTLSIPKGKSAEFNALSAQERKVKAPNRV